MDDVASVHSENENLRKIRLRVLQWDSKENPLAAFTTKQEEFFETLTSIWKAKCKDKPCGDFISKVSNITQSAQETTGKIPSESFQDLHNLTIRIENTNDFLLWYDRVNNEMNYHADGNYYKYLQQLKNRSEECQQILEKIDFGMNKLAVLDSEYAFVFNKTSSLNSSSETLIQEQQKLNEVAEEILRRLHFFNQIEHLHQRIQSPTLSVASDTFRECLDKIDQCLEYLKKNTTFKDASTFVAKYKQCLTKAVSLIKNYVIYVMTQATDATLTPRPQVPNSQGSSTSSSPDAVFALYYGKYQSSSAKIKRVSQMVEERIGKNPEYETLLYEIHQNYLSERANIMSPAVIKAIDNLNASNKGDHCSLVRSACAFLVHICQDEHRLFFQFFVLPSDHLTEYLEGLCTILYDSMRPFIIHINHLETLAEICSILRIEMIEEHVQQNPDSLEAFATTANQLLQDVQERLVFRAHLYLQSDILNYNPSSGDLAYPEKLEMMESIALSLQEPHLRRSDSRSSLISNVSSAVETESVDTSYRSRNMNSPADLHGMWYPTVRRTLVCLSRLYRCVDRPIFQGLSQEAIRLCIQSVSSAAAKISTAKTMIDGELFEIKHLLILREQIAPFRVDFTVKETSLDFSKIKTAAFGLLQKRKQLFSMNSNNALLEFLLDGTPQIKEHLLDSRKEVDRQLKTACEQFIKHAVHMLAGALMTFLEKTQEFLAVDTDKATKINYSLRQSQWATPQHISGIIQETQRRIKANLASLQRSMQLYLSNRDTEFIIFRPIRNNIISSFVKLEHIISTNGYTNDDMIIASCPTAEHVSILLSSTSILAADGMVNFVAARKVSTSSNEGGGISASFTQRKSSLDKKVSFDNSIVHDNIPEIPENSSTATSPARASPVPSLTSPPDL